MASAINRFLIYTSEHREVFLRSNYTCSVIPDTNSSPTMDEIWTFFEV